MWQEAKANEKKVKEMMADHKKRAERRRAYYNSKLGDPMQLLRIIGSNVKLYPNGEQYYYHENTNNLMPWQGDATLRIDRFDGRSLLEVIPEKSLEKGALDDEDFSDREELNFERYRDLVEANRLQVTEKERLELVDEEWVKILDRHKELLALINPQKKKSNAIGYDYGGSTTTTTEKLADDTNAEESILLNEADILKYINDLTETDRQILNDMGKKYGIRNYTRLLRVAKRDRDEILRQLQAKQQNRGGGGNGKAESKKSKRRKRKRKSRWNRDTESRNSRRGSPSYGNESYSDDDDTDTSDDDSRSSGDEEKSDFVIEFGSTAEPDDQQQQKPPVKQNGQHQSSTSNARDQSTTQATFDRKSSHHSQASGPTTEKKLTPMEKLKMKMRAGLEKTIQSDESVKLQKEQERHMDNIEQYAKEQHERGGRADFGPLVSPIYPSGSPTQTTTTQPTTTSRYRSPSSSRSPSPTNHRKSPSSPVTSTSRKTDRCRSPSPKRRGPRKGDHHYNRSPNKSSSSTEYSHRHQYHDRKSSSSSRHSSSYRESNHKRRRSRSRSRSKSKSKSRSRSRSRSRSPRTSSRRRHHRHSRR